MNLGPSSREKIQQGHFFPDFHLRPTLQALLCHWCCQNPGTLKCLKDHSQDQRKLSKEAASLLAAFQEEIHFDKLYVFTVCFPRINPVT